METHGRYSSQLFETSACYAGRVTAYMVVKRDATMCSAISRTAWQREPEPSNDRCILVMRRVCGVSRVKMTVLPQQTAPDT